MKKTRLECFEEKYVPDPNSGCWLWTGNLGRGYGHFWDGKKEVVAHRWSYEYFIGKIPNSLELDHLCRERCCVNPTHLEPVTHQENIQRGKSGVLKTHCIRGHKFTEENTSEYNGWRICKACKKISNQNYRDEQRATRSIA